MCEGLFRCAESLAAAGQGAESQAIYDDLRGLRYAPQQVRAGALRGAILARQKEGIPLMLEAIRGKDHVRTAAAARTAMEMPGPEVTAALASELPKLPAEKQVLLIDTLGYRGDASAGPALLALASKGPDNVRLAAIHNLTHLGYTPALTLLAELSLADNAELAAAARACLGSFPGKDADAAILALLAHKEAKVRRLAVEMVGQRNFAQSACSLLKAAADDDESVRIAALNALRDQAGLAELPALLNLLVKARSSAESQAAESALGALCARQSGPAAGKVVIVKAQYGELPEGPLADVTPQVAALVKAGALAVEASNDNFGDPAQGHPKKLRIDYRAGGVTTSKTVGEGETVTFTATSTPPAIVDAICGAMAEARGEAKLALLRALRSAGGPKALKTVWEAATDLDAQVRETALRVLCDWPTPDALPLLAELAKTPDQDHHQDHQGPGPARLRAARAPAGRARREEARCAEGGDGPGRSQRGEAVGAQRPGQRSHGRRPHAGHLAPGQPGAERGSLPGRGGDRREDRLRARRRSDRGDATGRQRDDQQEARRPSQRHRPSGEEIAWIIGGPGRLQRGMFDTSLATRLRAAGSPSARTPGRR